MEEKEERYLINDEIKQIIKDNTKPYKEKSEMLDISFYQDGKNLYDLYKYIVRIRFKNTKVKLEIKKYKNEHDCLEASIDLKNIKEGIEFLKLMNLTPGIYLKRDREVRKYKNLKIFIDEFDLIGDYVEIEYQDSNLVELEEFKKLCNITGINQDMYGTIINNRLKDDEFREEYVKRLNKIINKNT